MTAIRVQNLSKLYKLYDAKKDRLKEAINPFKKKYHHAFYALSDVTFEVKKGETIGIIGKNGSGKSTLLKMITGLITPTTGSIEVNGKVSALLELGAGFNPEYTGIENIYLNGTIMGFTREEMDEKLESIVSFADIGDFVHQPVKMYSSGMYVRLAFAVAINVEPDILIIDEALAVGDFLFQMKCYKKFEELKSMDKTIIFVSHSLDSIIKYCSRVLVLHEGCLQSQGEPAQMVDLYKKIMANCLDQGSTDTTNKSFIDADDFSDRLWKSDMDTNEKHLSYGNNKAEIVDCAVFDKTGKKTNIINAGEECTLRIKICFNQIVVDPIFAYTVKDVKGVEITGTNTMCENIVTGIFNDKDTVVVSFSQTFNLPNNHYAISFGCTGFDGDEFVVYHRLYDIFIVQFVNIKGTVGFFDPVSKIDMIKK